MPLFYSTSVRNKLFGREWQLVDYDTDSSDTVKFVTYTTAGLFSKTIHICAGDKSSKATSQMSVRLYKVGRKVLFELKRKGKVIGKGALESNSGLSNIKVEFTDGTAGIEISGDPTTAFAFKRDGESPARFEPGGRGKGFLPALFKVRDGEDEDLMVSLFVATLATLRASMTLAERHKLEKWE